MTISIEQQKVDWGATILARLKFHIYVNSVVGMTSWEQAEGGGFGNEAENNPLNSTEVMPGSWNVSPTGPGQWVQGYPDEETGIEATIKTLTNGDYVAILTALENGDSPTAIANIIGGSPWGTDGDTILECIPEATQWVSQFYHLNWDSEDNEMVIAVPKALVKDLVAGWLLNDLVYFEGLTVDGNPVWKPFFASDAQAVLNANYPIVSDETGGLLNRRPVDLKPLT